MTICYKCQREYIQTSMGDNGMCWECNNSTLPDYGDSTFQFTMIMPTYANHKDYSYVEYYGEYLLYKVEDDWFVWTESNDPDKWEEGVVYKSRNMADFVEHMIVFINELPNNTGTWSFDVTGSDFNTE